MKKAILTAIILAMAVSASFAASTRVAAPVTMKPGEAGFEEIPIGETQVGPYNVAAVYFQAVDMYPSGKNPSREDSDMHLEADIHLKPEDAIKYGFGNGEDIWPAYLTVKYEIIPLSSKKPVMSGSFMPMNADDGPHYGANIAKGLKVGKYKLKFIIEPPTDYLLHTDEETGVPAKEDAKNFFQTYTVEFNWDYTGEQLQND
ncbi:MAG: iron transporter [Synergistaceae bacterium]|nr:iron transporter [Synergistaceae bacterium]